MTDEKKPRDKAEIIVQMNKEAQRIKHRLGAEACIVIGFFKEGNQITVQDVGQFPMPPAQFYQLMIQAHSNGMLGPENKVKSKIIKPH